MNMNDEKDVLINNLALLQKAKKSLDNIISDIDEELYKPFSEPVQIITLKSERRRMLDRLELLKRDESAITDQLEAFQRKERLELSREKLMATSEAGQNITRVIEKVDRYEILLKKLENQLADLFDKINNARAKLVDPTAEGAAIQEILDSIPKIPDPHPKSFEEELCEFKRVIESKCSDVFWRKKAEERFTENPERKAQSLFVTYFAAKIKPENVFREIRSGVGRIDGLVTYKGKNYLIEMKMLGGKYSLSKVTDGIDQLFIYMDQQNSQIGYLLVFDGRQHSKKETVPMDQSKNGRQIKLIDIDINPLSATNKIREAKRRREEA